MARYQEDREAVTESGETLFPRRSGTGVWGNKISQQGKQLQHQKTLFPRGVVAMVWGNKQRKQESNITDQKSEIMCKKSRKM